MAEKSELAEAFKNRTKRFALNTIHVFRTLPKNEEARVIGRQLLRSATSIAANYRAACRARSKAEFFSKISISLEEADETQLWIELLIDAEIGSRRLLQKLHQEANEITAILTASRKTTSPRNN